MWSMRASNGKTIKRIFGSFKNDKINVSIFDEYTKTVKMISKQITLAIKFSIWHAAFDY